MVEISRHGKLLLAVLLGAFSVAVVSSVLQGWMPVSDEALMELSVRDVPSHLPLTGVWSRFGWNHPGPSQFYYLSAFYWIGGGTSVALLVGTVAMNAVFALMAWWMARQLDRLTGMVCLAGVVLILLSSSAAMLRSPWNPYVATIGCVALCCAAWSFGERYRAGLIALLPIGSFLVQAHLVTAPMVACTTVAAIIVIFIRRDRSLSLSALTIGASVALAMWIPPLSNNCRAQMAT